MGTLTIRDAYEASLRREGHIRDPAQLEIITKLEDLQRRILDTNPPARGVRGLISNFRKRQWPSIEGLYIWGGVGRGKTFLMDLFFECLELEEKKRIHFHRMMHDVHARLRALGDIEDPLDIVAADIANETRVSVFR